MFTQRKFYLLLFLVLLVGLACVTSQGVNLPTSTAGGAQVEPGQPTKQGSVPEPKTAATATLVPRPTPTATPLPPPTLPIGLRQGLSGLNSYHLQVHIISNGPKEQDKSDTLTLTDYSKDEDATHIHTETSSSTVDSPDTNKSVSEQYRIGDKSCSFTPTDTENPNGTIETNPSSQEAMLNGLLNLFDIQVFAEDPVLVGPETVNGIATNHFTFKVSGLSAVSGAEVTQSQGEYWIALEGQYLVKYSAVIETRTAPVGDPNADVTHLEVQIELSNVDTPITIAMPPECK